jgi:hypothetical protein
LLLVHRAFKCLSLTPAALFTEDGVFVTPQGPIYGRDAIEKYYADRFHQWHFSNHLNQADQNSPHGIGTASNEMWAIGEFSQTFKARTALLYRSRVIGQRFLFVRAMFGRIGC